MGVDFRGLEMGIGKLVLQIEKFRVGPPGVLARDSGVCAGAGQNTCQIFVYPCPNDT